MKFTKQNIERAFDKFMQGGNDSFADLKERIINLVDELVPHLKTSDGLQQMITKREDEPTYYLKSKIRKMDGNCYLNWVKDEDRVTFLDKHSTPNFSSRLTKSGWEYAAGCSWEELLVMFNAEPYEEEEE